VRPSAAEPLHVGFRPDSSRLSKALLVAPVLGSFIFGLPTDREDTFDATLQVAQRAHLTFAQFVMLTPFPGTVDFGRWEKAQGKQPPSVGEVPITRYWLIPPEIRPKMFMPHPTMSSEELRKRTQEVWDRFYSFASIWRR